MMLTQSPEQPATEAYVEQRTQGPGADSADARDARPEARRRAQGGTRASLSSYEVLLHLSWAPGHRMRTGELALRACSSPLAG